MYICISLTSVEADIVYILCYNVPKHPFFQKSNFFATASINICSFDYFCKGPYYLRNMSSRISVIPSCNEADLRISNSTLIDFQSRANFGPRISEAHPYNCGCIPTLVQSK